jgi:hypothetical protein
MDYSTADQELPKSSPLEVLLLEAIKEGNLIEGTPDYWKEKRELVRRLADLKVQNNQDRMTEFEFACFLHQSKLMYNIKASSAATPCGRNHKLFCVNHLRHLFCGPFSSAPIVPTWRKHRMIAEE